MAVEGGIVSHYYILVIGKSINFMSLFRHQKFFSHIAAYSKAERTDEQLVFWCKTKES